MLAAALSYLAFAVLALAGPGLALQRLLRLRIDPALVLPMGFACCAGAYWLSLAAGLPWLFPAAIAALDLCLLRPRQPWARAAGPSLRGAAAPLLGLVAFLAWTEYPSNRPGPRGEFLFDNVVPEDTTFHVALAFELTVTTPPQVPGLSGVPMGYHLGLPLVRAAAVRWAGVDPCDVLSRFEITLVALAAVLALRGMAAALGGGAAAVAAVGWTLLAADFSFLFAGQPNASAWLYWTDANLLFSLVHANSSVMALLLALCALMALRRHQAGEGRGWLALAAAAGFAVPHFKAFVAAHLLLGLGAAALLTRRWREPLLAGLPAAAGLATIVLGRASAEMAVVIEPLTLVERLRTHLERAGGGTASLLGWTAVWLLASLGLRAFGIGEALRALRAASTAAAALAAMALAGWPIGLLFRVLPRDYAGVRPAYNEAWYFVEQSAPLLWIFTVLALTRLPLRGLRGAVAAAAAAALALPSTVQFALVKRAVPPATIPPAIVAGMQVLKAASRPGDVVLQRPEPKRFPPPPMVLAGRRIPYTRYIPYLYQVAPRARLAARIEEVRAFFRTRDPDEARRIARGLGARFVCLYGDDAVAFPIGAVLRPLFERPNLRVYEILEAAPPS